jgi:hypothetical protein
MLGLLLLGLLIGVPGLASAQLQAAPGMNATLTGARGDAANRCDSATSSAGSATTLTLVNPGPGLSAYITAIAIWGLASGATSGATATEATMTGVNGTTPKLMPLQLVYPAAGAQGSVAGGYVPLSTPIKGLANTAVAIVGPTGITNLIQDVIACYYSAP